MGGKGIHNVATEFRRGSIWRLIPAHQNEIQISHPPVLPLVVASENHHDEQPHFRKRHPARNRHRCCHHLLANALENRSRTKSSREEVHISRSKQGGTKTRGQFRPAYVVLPRASQPAISRCPCVSSIYEGQQAARLPSDRSSDPPHRHVVL